MAAPAEAAGLGELDDKVEKVEFKVTVLKTDEPKVRGLLAGAEPVSRTVYFYDTQDLDLDRKHVVLRARITGENEQSTVKLRPVPLPVPPPWSQTEDVELEADVVGAAEPTTSAKLDRTLDPGDIEPTRKPSKLFNKEQEKLIGPSLDDLQVLGPIDALKWEPEPADFPFKLEIEEWTIEDGLHFIELSIKVKRAEADRAQREWHALLDGRAISRTHEQVSKTRVVLTHFAAKLRR